MTPGPKVPKDAQEALDIGFERGRTTRQQTSDPGEKLNFWRKSFEEAPGFELECWPGRSMFYEQWRRGFDAGYLGRPKPTLLTGRSGALAARDTPLRSTQSGTALDDKAR